MLELTNNLGAIERMPISFVQHSSPSIERTRAKKRPLISWMPSSEAFNSLSGTPTNEGYDLLSSKLLPTTSLCKFAVLVHAPTLPASLAGIALLLAMTIQPAKSSGPLGQNTRCTVSQLPFSAVSWTTSTKCCHSSRQSWDV